MTVDFGHRNNNLADNNNAKAFGGRCVFGAGDVRIPWPFPEEAADLTGVSVGVSGMGGRYDLEGYLDSFLYGLDLSFHYLGLHFSGEYMYSYNHFLAPLGTSATTLAAPLQQVRSREEIHGYFLQTSFPVLRKAPVGKRVTGIVVFNQVVRRGPQLDLFLNYNDGNDLPVSAGVQQPSPDRHAMDRQIHRGAQLGIDRSFFSQVRLFVLDHGKIHDPLESSLGLVDIYQTAFSMVMSF